jgi:hypothetical protein
MYAALTVSIVPAICCTGVPAQCYALLSHPQEPPSHHGFGAPAALYLEHWLRAILDRRVHTGLFVNVQVSLDHASAHTPLSQQ